MTKKEISFEEALNELQSVVERLEAGKAPLEESLALYERGVELVTLCNQRLDSAEQRVNALKLGKDGVQTEPFAAHNEA